MLSLLLDKVSLCKKDYNTSIETRDNKQFIKRFFILPTLELCYLIVMGNRPPSVAMVWQRLRRSFMANLNLDIYTDASHQTSARILTFNISMWVYQMSLHWPQRSFMANLNLDRCQPAFSNYNSPHNYFKNILISAYQMVIYCNQMAIHWPHSFCSELLTFQALATLVTRCTSIHKWTTNIIYINICIGYK